MEYGNGDLESGTGNRKLESGIRSPESGIRNPMIMNDDRNNLLQLCQQCLVNRYGEKMLI